MSWACRLESEDGGVGKVAMPTLRSRVPSFYRTVLLFQDQADIQALQVEFPALADRVRLHTPCISASADPAVKFPSSSQHTHGMVSGFIWTALATEGVGVNIQHFNPQINEAIAKAFGTPESWTLTAQLVFGKREGEPEGKSFKDSEDTVKVFGAKE